MFKKFKEMVLEALVEGEARFQVQQDKSRAMFRDPNETPEQIQKRLKEINDMISPQAFAKQVELINSGATSKEPTYQQIINNQKEADAQAIMMKKTDIRKEIQSWGEKGQNQAVLEIVADAVKTKAIGGIQSIRDKAFGSKEKDNSFKLN